MRKILLALIAAVFLTLVLPDAAMASGLYHITDAAGILTYDEDMELEARAAEIAEKYRCAVYIITIDTIDGADVYEFAKYFYVDYDLGYGADKSGLLMLVSVDERELGLAAFGYGNTAFTDHGKNVLLDRNVLPPLKDNRWYDAFGAYLDTAEEFLVMARAGTPFDTHNDENYQKEINMTYLALTILLPLIAAYLLCHKWKSQMKTAVPAVAAHQYIPQNGFKLTKQEDLFLYRTETRRKIQQQKPSGGGTTVDRSGFSGTKRKF